MEDSTGRWFSFRAEPTTVLILEKGKLPDHLKGLPCVDSPTRVSTLLRELEDAGEALQYHAYILSTLHSVRSSFPDLCIPKYILKAIIVHVRGLAPR